MKACDRDTLKSSIRTSQEQARPTRMIRPCSLSSGIRTTQMARSRSPPLRLSSRTQGRLGRSSSSITVSLRLRTTFWGQGLWQISHLKLARLQTVANRLNCCVILLAIHRLRQDTWTKEQLPRHWQGEMQGLDWVCSSQHTLHGPSASFRYSIRKGSLFYSQGRCSPDATWIAPPALNSRTSSSCLPIRTMSPGFSSQPLGVPSAVLSDRITRYGCIMALPSSGGAASIEKILDSSCCSTKMSNMCFSPGLSLCGRSIDSKDTSESAVLQQSRQQPWMRNRRRLVFLLSQSNRPWESFSQTKVRTSRQGQSGICMPSSSRLTLSLVFPHSILIIRGSIESASRRLLCDRLLSVVCALLEHSARHSVGREVLFRGLLEFDQLGGPGLLAALRHGDPNEAAGLGAEVPADETDAFGRRPALDRCHPLIIGKGWRTSHSQSDMVRKAETKLEEKQQPSQRPYLCSCGKSYLSYPALYTHIKNKKDDRRTHTQVRSEETQGTKRGRPPVRPAKTREPTLADVAEDLNNEARNEVELLLIELIKLEQPGLAVILEGNEYPDAEQLQSCLEGLEGAGQLREQFIKLLPLSEDQLYADDSRRINQSDIVPLSVYCTLARFLHALAQQLRPPLVRELCALLGRVAAHFNSLVAARGTVVDLGAGDNCGRLAGDYLIEYLNEIFERVGREGLLGKEQLVKQVLFRLGRWLIARKYTALEIEMEVM